MKKYSNMMLGLVFLSILTASLLLPANGQLISTDDQRICTNTYYHSSEIPATCIGGIMTQDLILSNSCRSISCSSNGNLIVALVCDKPGVFGAQYFEMYLQQKIGSGLKICLGKHCVGSLGFARSTSFPIRQRC